MNLEKTLKISKGIIKILKVLVVINIFVALALFFFSINSDFREFASTSMTLTLGVFKLVFKDAIVNTAIENNYLTYACLITIILCFLWYLILRHISMIVDNSLKSSIFCKENTRSMNLIGIFILISGFIKLLTEIMSVVTIQRNINTLEIFNPALISSVSIEARLDVSFLIIAFVIFVLAKVFAYGQQLQQLSDETL